MMHQLRDQLQLSLIVHPQNKSKNKSQRRRKKSKKKQKATAGIIQLDGSEEKVRKKKWTRRFLKR